MKMERNRKWREKSWLGENHGTTPWIGIGCGAAMPRAMSVVCWNCQGLGNPYIVKALQKLVLEEDPTFVFLMETKVVVSEMTRTKHKLDR